jgi:hypothetical protein
MAALPNPLRHAAGGENGSIMVGMFVCLCLASQKPSERDLFVPARMDLDVKLLTGIRLWVHICAYLNFELCDCLITFPIFVLSQRLIARNVCELFSFNRGVLHLNKACCIDDVSRGSLSCYEILTNN